MLKKRGFNLDILCVYDIVAIGDQLFRVAITRSHIIPLKKSKEAITFRFHAINKKPFFSRFYFNESRNDEKYFHFDKP